MARETYQPSLVDRLCAAGRASGDSGTTLEEARESVRRDLEDLFNSRQGRDDVPPGCTELARSVATYGLRSFDSTNLEAHAERQRLLKAIERTIRLFEPRLDRVEVEDLGLAHPFLLRFKIHAVLRIGREGDRVVFGTTVRKDGHARVEAEE